MPKAIEAQQRWRRTLPEGEPIVLGRRRGVWAVPWDHHISRRHARSAVQRQRLEVALLPEARNPLFLRGQEVERCALAPGEHFVIGQTTFTLADQQATSTADAPDRFSNNRSARSISGRCSSAIRTIALEVLSRLPDVISGAAGDQELFVRLVSMLLAGVPRADAAAVVAVDEDVDEGGVKGGRSPIA